MHYALDHQHYSGHLIPIPLDQSSYIYYVYGTILEIMSTFKKHNGFYKKMEWNNDEIFEQNSHRPTLVLSF